MYRKMTSICIQYSSHTFSSFKTKPNQPNEKIKRRRYMYISVVVAGSFWRLSLCRCPYPHFFLTLSFERKSDAGSLAMSSTIRVFCCHSNNGHHRTCKIVLSMAKSNYKITKSTWWIMSGLIWTSLKPIYVRHGTSAVLLAWMTTTDWYL